MNNKTTHTSSGIGFGTALTLIFVVLKLTNLIQWSWVWILSPLWITFSIWLCVFVIMVIVLSIVAIIDTAKHMKEGKNNGTT